MGVMDYLNKTGQEQVVVAEKRIPYTKIRKNGKNSYPIIEIEDLSQSLATVGLEQNLVVKETDEEEVYELVTGERRLTSIEDILSNPNKYPINDKIKNDLSSPRCIVISKDENPLITHLRLHTTNVEVRGDLSDYDMVTVVEDYLNTIAEIKKQNLTVNGMEIKGKSRELLMKHFGMSDGTAKKYLAVIKADDDVKNDMKENDKSVNAVYEELQEKKKETKKDKVESDGKKADGYLPELATELSYNLGTKVILKNKKMTITFKDESDLNRILEILGLDK